MKRFFSLLFLLQGFLLHAQGLFQQVAPAQISPAAGSRTWQPTAFSAFQTDISAVSAILANAPMEMTPEANYGKPTVLAIPQADGTTEDFAVVKVMTCEQAIYDRHPEIRTFSGRSLSNPYKTVRGSVTIRGFRAMVFEADRSVTMVEPYVEGQTSAYIAYKSKDMPEGLIPAGLTRGVTEGAKAYDRSTVYATATTTSGERTDAELQQLKTYRFAASCTGEFGEDHGGTQETAFAAVVEYSNWVSGIFEKDIALRLQLIEGCESIAFFNPDTDPFTLTDPVALLGLNALVINGFIGINNYDIGHCYTRYPGGSILGVAGAIGNACVASAKAEGVSTGYKNVYGENFINTIGQELGHQLGGGHTWNRCGGGNGRNGASAFEPGSGSTIMSYAGACGTDNVQTYSDLYFHAGSIEEIQQYYTLYLGATCGTFTTTDNHRPEVTLPYTNDFFIPIETPFELFGSATDVDGDTLTYCWEQMNTGPETALETPVGNSPLFRTWPPSDNTNRYFPQLTSILGNTSMLSEQLPTYDRDLTFRLSAREARLTNNAVGWKDVEFRATALAGPFLVTKPNTSSTTWYSGQYVKVEWDVANTFVAPVNCKKVNIRLSLDGGQTWPITLASGVANDGEHTVQAPPDHTGNARIRVEAADNVFFDVSNTNFKILAPNQPGLSAGMSENTTAICLPGSFTTQVLTAAVLGFNNPVTIAIVPGDLPAGSTATLSTTSIQPGQSATLTVDMANVIVAGTFHFGVRVTSPGADTSLFSVSITATTNNFATMALVKPNDGSTNLTQTQILRWSKAQDATSYDVQLSTSAAFAPGTIIASKSNTQLDTFKIPFLLEKNKAYFWRIRPNNICSPHAWTAPFFFSTLTENCASYTSDDLPVNISANSANTVESKLDVNVNSTITDVNIKELRGFHGYFNDLEAKLISPTGTEVILFKNKCSNYNGVFDLGLDDDAPNPFQCPPGNNGTVFVRPQNPLAPFIGQNAQGTWTLRVRDNTPGEGGVVEALELDICQSAIVNPPFIINNNTLSIATGTNQQISADLLLAGDNDNTHDQLTYTLLTIPNNGFLATDLQGTLKAGDHFTQTDLDNGKLRYFDYGLGAGSDYFRFMIADGNGGYLGSQTYFIAPVVDANVAPDETNMFSLYPNPADEMVWLAMEKPASTDLNVSLYNAAGQLVRTEIMSRGTSRLRIETGGLPKGMYFTRVEGVGKNSIQKLILR